MEDTCLKDVNGRDKVTIPNSARGVSAAEFRKIMEELTDIDKFTKEELHDMVFHDGITRSYNWNYLWQFLFFYEKRDEVNYNFVDFDIKDFKAINEIYSVFLANELLQLIVDTLNAETDWVICAVRSDNDNFALLTKSMSEEELTQKLYAFFDKVSYLPCDPDYKVYYRAGIVMGEDAKKYVYNVGNYAKYAQRQCQVHAKTEIKTYTDDQFQKYLVGKNIFHVLMRQLQTTNLLCICNPNMIFTRKGLQGQRHL